MKNVSYSTVLSASDLAKLGVEYLNQGNYQEALNYYNKSLNIDPKNYVNWGNKGHALRALGRSQEAIECYDKALSFDLNYAWAWAEKGAAMTSLGRYQEALQCCDKALSLVQNDFGALGFKGQALRNLGRNQEAIECYDKSLSFKPNYAWAWAEKGAARNNLCQYQKALQCYDQGFSHGLNDKWAWGNKGQVLRNLGRNQEAIECYDKALSLDPSYAWAWTEKGTALHLLSRFEDALQCFDKTLSLDSNNALAWSNKAASLLNLARSQEAIQCYDKALSLGLINSKETWVGKGMALAKLDRYQEALQSYDKSLAIDSKYEFAIEKRKEAVKLSAGDPTKLGIEYLNQGNYQEALNYYNKALDADPKNKINWGNKGQVLRYLGRNQEAIECYDKALSLDPSYAWAWAEKGLSLHYLSRFQDALQCCDKTLSLDSSNTLAWATKAASLLDLARSQEAIQCYDKTLSLGLNSKETWVGKGMALAKLDRYQEALQCYDKSLAIDSKYEFAIEKRKEALDKLNASPNALKTLPNAEVKVVSEQLQNINLNSPTLMQNNGVVLEQKKKVESDSIQFSHSLTINYSTLKLGKCLGEGGFGIVYQGTKGQEEVAIKQLKIASVSEDARAEFETEVQTMARLRSKYIVQFYGYCLSPKYTIVMEYMPKGSLTSLLLSKASINFDLSTRLMTEMACGLSALHAENILHRDIKSMNVLLDEDCHAKLSDFGLSKIKNETRTSTKSVGGTIQWMAPELFSLRPKHSKKSDVYSLGMTFWEVAARSLPYQGAAEAVIKDSVKQGEREQIPENCPKRWATIIQACWEGNPDQRPESDAVAAYLKSGKDDFATFLPSFNASRNVSSNSPAVNVNANAANLSDAANSSANFHRALVGNLASGKS